MKINVGAIVISDNHATVYGLDREDDRADVCMMEL